MKWPLKRLADLGAISTGSTPRTTESRFYGGDLPFVTPAELDTGVPVMSTPRTLTEEGAAEARVLPEGAVMVSCIGSLGKIGIAGRSLATNQQINSVVFEREKIWPKYGFYACRLLKPKLDCMAPATTLPIVSKSKFAELTIPLPPLAEQRRIAEVLDRAEALRDKRSTVLAQLASLTQSLFLDLFGDPTYNTKRFPSKPLSSLVRDDDTINYGVVQPGDDHAEGIPLVRVGDLIEGKVRHANLKRIAPSIEAAYKRSRLRGDEVLVSCVGSIGVVALASESEKGFNIARAIARIPLTENTNRVFLSAYLNTDFVQRYFTNELRTVSQPTLNIKQLSQTSVVLPPIELQRKFARRVTVVEKLKAAHRASLAELDALFTALQHRAFKGEL
ncbi:MAG: restriction endonuclease subunit S [Pyrinomonadaceae bacterium]|nr:restriction endonuclease subunit S [Pyrinomonadaceae bacterium]